MHSLGWVIAVLLIVAGVAGTVLPALPGTPLVFCGMLLAAWVDQFSRVSVATVVVLGLLTAIATALDFAVAALGAKHVGASRQALVGAVIGTVFGIFTGFVGLIVWPFVGAAVGEFMARRDLYQAGKVGLATWIGIVLGSIFKLGVALLMVGLFITAYLWN